MDSATGSKFAPAFTNMFVSRLERKRPNELTMKPWPWWRLLDDVFLVWLHGRNTLSRSVEYAHCYHPNIKYTWEFSNKEILNLNVRVEIK